MFIRVKIIKGNNYFYLVENKRYGKKVKQRFIHYFGKTKPDAQLLRRVLSFVGNEINDKNNRSDNDAIKVEKTDPTTKATSIL